MKRILFFRGLTLPTASLHHHKWYFLSLHTVFALTSHLYLSLKSCYPIKLIARGGDIMQTIEGNPERQMKTRKSKQESISEWLFFLVLIAENHSICATKIILVLVFLICENLHSYSASQANMLCSEALFREPKLVMRASLSLSLSLIGLFLVTFFIINCEHLMAHNSDKQSASSQLIGK